MQGVALIEVMVSLLVFMIAVLGVVGLQAKALQYSVQAEDRSRAAVLANDLVTLMWTSQSTSLPAEALDAWKARLTDTRHGLPGAVATVSDADASGVVTITIAWASIGAASTDAASHQYVTRVVLR